MHKQIENYNIKKKIILPLKHPDQFRAIKPQQILATKLNQISEMKLLKFPCLVFLLQLSFRECERYAMNIQRQIMNLCFNSGDEARLVL